MIDSTFSRRGFLGAAAGSALALNARNQVAMIDYHAHVDAVPTLDELFDISKKRGIRFGVVEHAGNRKDHGYRGLLANDDDLNRYLSRLEAKPCYKGIQAEGLDWMKCFSKDAVARLDYVLTDALTMPDRDGTLVRIWTPAAARFQDKQDFMDRYTAHNVKVIETEPIDILANPLFIPTQFQPEFDALWTEKRMAGIVRAAVRNGVAFEINSRFRLPAVRFLTMAKDAGAKFSFGSNNLGQGVGDLSYGREMIQKLDLQPKDIFTPARAGRKPIQVRTF